jgi:hypothetical protein
MVLHVALGFCIAFVASAYALVLETASDHPISGDFVKFHTSARFLVEGEDIYRPVPAIDFVVGDTVPFDPATELHPNLNPPFQTVLLSPLGHLDYRTAYVLWGALSLAGALVGALLVGASVGPPGRRVSWALLLTLVLFLYFPTFISIFSGQWSLLPFAFLVGAWVAWRSGRQALAGGILGAIAAIKLFFGAFFLLFLARREWRAGVGFVVSWTACTTLALLVTGWSALLRYLGILGDAVWYSASWNASFMGFFSRIFGGSEGAPLLDMAWLTPVLHYGLGGLSVFGLFWLSRRSARSREVAYLDDLTFSFCIVIMLLVSPFGWMYYFPFLLIPLAVLWRASSSLEHPWRYRIWVVLAWALSTVPRFIMRLEDMEGDLAVIFGWAGAYFYALVLFATFILVMHGRLRRESLPAR